MEQSGKALKELENRRVLQLEELNWLVLDFPFGHLEGGWSIALLFFCWGG